MATEMNIFSHKTIVLGGLPFLKSFSQKDEMYFLSPRVLLNEWKSVKHDDFLTQNHHHLSPFEKVQESFTPLPLKLFLPLWVMDGLLKTVHSKSRCKTD